MNQQTGVLCMQLGLQPSLAVFQSGFFPVSHFWWCFSLIESPLLPSAFLSQCWPSVSQNSVIKLTFPTVLSDANRLSWQKLFFSQINLENVANQIFLLEICSAYYHTKASSGKKSIYLQHSFSLSTIPAKLLVMRS